MENLSLYGQMYYYINSNLEITIQLDDLLDCDTFSKLLFNQIEKNIISVLNKSLQSYISSIIKKEKHRDFKKNIPQEIKSLERFNDTCEDEYNFIYNFNSLLKTNYGKIYIYIKRKT